MSSIDPFLQKLMEEQEQKGGLNVTLLEKGTKLTIETKNSIYQVVVVEGREVTISGGMTKEGQIRFPLPAKAIILGSTWGGSMLKIDWIGQDMRMELNLMDEPAHSLLTSVVQNVEIEAPDGSWSYDMNWKD